MPALPRGVRGELGLEDEGEAELYCLVTVPDGDVGPPRRTCARRWSVQPAGGTARQVVLADGDASDPAAAAPMNDRGGDARRSSACWNAGSGTAEPARSRALPWTADPHTHGGVLVLTLTRSVGETIRIGDDIEVHVVEVRGGTVRLGFKAPREVAIHREEVYRQIAEANLLAAQVTADTLGALAAFAPRAPEDDAQPGAVADAAEAGATAHEPPVRAGGDASA